ncbi:MAG: hypothetical protein WEE20_05460 [Bacteroidota bacterium]
MRIVHKVLWCLMLLVAVGEESRAQDERVIPTDREALLQGLGMGLATYGEVNSYPGPKHVLELKDELALTRDQQKKVEVLENAVKISAGLKGEEIVQAEEELFQLFELGTINERVLRTKLEQIGKLRAELRFIHLQAHIRTKQILSADQIKRYNTLRGYEIKSENDPARQDH